MIFLIEPSNHSVIDTHTDIQNKFINTIQKQGIAAALEWILPMKNGDELSHPVPVRFSWTAEGTIPYVFEISESKDFYNSFTAQTNEPFLVWDNFKLGQTYYWRVNQGDYYTFETVNNGFRFIKLDGVFNVRDLGGINIKQGLLYRGSEINKE